MKGRRLSKERLNLMVLADCDELFLGLEESLVRFGFSFS